MCSMPVKQRTSLIVFLSKYAAYCTKKCQVEIRSMTEADLEEALNILDLCFFNNESVCNGCEINLPQNALARKQLRDLCEIVAKDGVSLVAKSISNGEIVAASFNKIQYIPEEGEESFFVEFRNKHTTSPEALCLMDFMIEVDGRTDVFELFKIDCVCELMFLSTLPQWGRKGIASMLAKYTIELTRNLWQGIGLEDIHPTLRSKRPCGVTSLFTSQFSQKAGASQGFKVLNTVSFTEFSYNGKTFDQRISPLHKNCTHVAIIF